ncbi:MAG: hypothetical protein ACKO81_10140, partial [Planctomycetota bacterium]
KLEPNCCWEVFQQETLQVHSGSQKQTDSTPVRLCHEARAVNSIQKTDAGFRITVPEQHGISRWRKSETASAKMNSDTQPKSRLPF